MICRGFYDAYARRSPALRLLRAFGRLTEVDPPRPGPSAERQVTPAEAVTNLRTPGTVAVRDLAVPAVIRPGRDGW